MLKCVTGSSPKCPLRFHSLVCIKNYLFTVGIWIFFDKELICIFDLFLLFLRLTGDRSKYYKINIIYTSIFNICYNGIYLRCFLCFGADTEILYVFVSICLILSTKTHSSGYINQSAVVCIIYRAPNSGAITGVERL